MDSTITIAPEYAVSAGDIRRITPEYAITAEDIRRFRPDADTHNRECPECGKVARMLSEAYSENNRRNERPATAEEVKEVTAARELGATPEQLARIRTILEERNAATRELSSLRSQVAALQGEDIQGDDPRLIPFWVSAAREATAAGYCPEYDRIAQMAGGPSRDDLAEAGHLTDTYRVRVRVYGYVKVEASSYDDAYEIVGDYDIDDIDEWEDITTIGADIVED